MDANSKEILFINAVVIGNNRLTENSYVSVRNGLIEDIGYGIPHSRADTIIDCGGNYLSPGFIDLHTHGGGGFDFMDGDVKAIIDACRMHVKHGTTSIYPTTMTCPDEDLFLFFENYEKALEIKEDMPNLMGIHLEGPYFSPVQCGAQSSDEMRIPKSDEYIRILDAAHGNIARWSIAPELEGAFALGKELASRGIQAAIAHSNATYEEVLKAVECGYSHVTHLYSGMSTITRNGGFRVLGIVESAYLLDDLTVEIIADGCHLPPELLRLIVKNKSRDSICLVTDSMRGAGMPEGPSILGSITRGQAVIIEDGVAKMPDRASFAGSVATSDHLIRVMIQKANLSIVDAVAMMSQNPAKIMGIDHRKGSIAIGKDADLLICDRDFNIKQVFVMGNPVLSYKEDLE